MDVAALARRLCRDGFVQFRADVAAHEAQARFSQSWNALPLDTYMGDGGLYRRRRFGIFHVGADSIEAQPHQPHYQRRAYNALNGGIDRWFEPLDPDIASHPVLHDLLNGVMRIIGHAEEARRWRAEIHQFRIEAMRDRAGLPTPEGLHRDGVDWVLITLIDRCNVVGGISDIRSPKGETLASFALAQPFESILLDDRRVLHGVTPIFAGDAGPHGRRDALVATFRRL
jgi:hypothetical protein